MASEAWIQYVLARYSTSPVHAFSQLLLLPNCKTTPIWWECDLLAISRSGYCTEVEIKVSMSDWRRDILKGKHAPPTYATSSAPLIKRFYYAGPIELMRRHAEVKMPDHAGVLGVMNHPSGGWPKVEVLKKPVDNKKARKLTDQELLAFGHTAMVRYWMWAAWKDGDPDFQSEAQRDAALKKQLAEFEGRYGKDDDEGAPDIVQRADGARDPEGVEDTDTSGPKATTGP